MAVKDMLNTYSHIQNKEELATTIADLFADEVPAFAIAKKERVKNQTVKWVSDSLATANRTAVAEGATITYTDKTLATLNTNYTQIRDRSWEVTHSQEASDSVGLKSSVKRELMKAMKELVVDFDLILQTTNAAAAGDTGTARVSAGIHAVATTNTEAGSGNGSTSYVALKESQVNSLLEKIWKQGGNPRVLLCGGYQKRVISQDFTAKTGFSFNVDAGQRMAIQNINKYEGSFGTLDVIPDRQHPGTRIAIIDPNMWKVGILNDITQYKGAKTSSSYKGWVEGEMCLKYGNQKGHGVASYLTTSFAL